MKKYVIACMRHRDMYFGGDSVLFWGPDSSGYTAVLQTAGLYSEEKASEIAKGTHGDEVPIELSQLGVTEDFFCSAETEIKDLSKLTLVNGRNESIRKLINQQRAKYAQC
ncbi:hypothetical protein [Paenibacillus polymyxa]|uniref:hypothetical protein n=1 Tax=Paenibacillus polymyxa TaxID=1406 RepID=UPI0025B68E89|nr:hypothetical protein [Paenibacillus polymyxa]MDN4090883.1 hypothetical protein [Paenibacillus polymyxa]